MPDIASAPDVSAEGAHPQPDTPTGSSQTDEANAHDVDASARRGGSHPAPMPENRNRTSEPGEKMQPLSYTQNTTAAVIQAIFTDHELAGLDDTSREAARAIFADTSSKEFALTLTRSTQRYRENMQPARHALRDVIESAIECSIDRRAQIHGSELLAMLAYVFCEANPAGLWDEVEFLRNADPRLGDRFMRWLWDQRCTVAKADDPRASAEYAVRCLLSNARTLDGEVVKTALLQEFGELADVESAWREHVDERDRQARESAFCSALASAVGVAATSALHPAHAFLETLRDDPSNDDAIDGIANWIEKQVRDKYKVATVAFLARKVNEFAEADDPAYDDIRLALDAERRDALTKIVSEAIGAEAAQALEKNHYDLDMYLSMNRDAPAVLWGDGKEILWAKGEALLICSDIGCGKTTLAGLLARALLDSGDVLGYPVASLRDQARVLYLALDRPAQIGRSLARQITPDMSERYGDSFTFVSGPLPIDLSETPDVFPHIADYYGADIVIVDSLKDIAMGISEDRAMANYNRARQSLLASGRDLIELHHLTKKGELYGAKWLDAGVGSVLRISGKPGATTSTVSQYKPVAHLVSDIKVVHDRDAGDMHVADAVPLPPVETEAAAKPALPDWVGQHDAGVTLAEVSAFLYGTDGRATRGRAKRVLDGLSGDGGPLACTPGKRGGDEKMPARWVVRK
jgi:energy-coupling factor transporter ATP-binding protein EcfA2